MSEEVLFSITRDKLDTGLRGFPVGYCNTSAVDPYQGLSYRGYLIKNLAHKDPEEVIYLLFNGELPSNAQLKEFKARLQSLSKVPPEVIKALKSFPKKGHPMKWLIASLTCLGMANPQENYSEAAIRLIAQLPEIVAAIFRIRSGWGDLIKSNPELGYMENFSQMLGAPEANSHLTRILRVFNIVHMDHGGGNLSTFVGKAVASGHEDIYGSLAGAMAGLAGPLHGMANQECIQFLREMLYNLKDYNDDEEIAAYIRNVFNGGGVIYGFGHAVLRVEDPRATVQYDLGEMICRHDALFRLAQKVRILGSEFLKTQPKVKDPYPNVDGISGTLLNFGGLKNEQYYTVLFGLSRCVGIAAQIVYEREEARGGKGTPIVRPKYLYSGPTREESADLKNSTVG